MVVKYFHQGLWPSNSPAATFATCNALGFAEQGADFELLTVRNSRLPAAQVLRDTFGIERPLAVRLLRAGPLRRSHRFVYALASAYLLTARWDVLITRNLGFLPWALLLRRLRGGLVVFESHDFYSDLALRDIPGEKPPLKYMRQERRYLPRVDAVLCVSEQQRLYYLQCYPAQRFLTAVSGVKTHGAPPSRRPQGPTAGYLGTFDSGLYDFDLLFAAFARLRTPSARLLVVGGRSPQEVAAMRARAARHNVAARVEVLPWQTGQEFEATKARLSVGLAPLVVNGRNRIGSPLKVLEYLSAGIPVVASDLPGIRYLVGDGACGLTAQDDPASWAAAISRVLEQPAFAATLSANCLAASQDLSWPRRAGRILAFLRELRPRRAGTA